MSLFLFVAPTVRFIAGDFKVGEDVVVSEHTTAVLNCTYSTTGREDLYWYKGDDEGTWTVVIYVPNSEEPEYQTGFDRHDIVGQASLQITQTVVNDSDTYWCLIVGLGVQTEMDSLSLNVIEIRSPSIPIVTLSENPTHEGHNVTLLCESYGVPLPTFEWMKDGIQLQEQKRYHFTTDMGSFMIVSVSRKDMSNYTCIASNDGGSKKTTVFLNVYYEPDYVWPTCSAEPLSNIEFLEAGNSITLICEAVDGNPFPVLLWYNGTEILPQDGYNTPSSEDKEVITRNEYTFMLTKYDNDKIYQCNGHHPVSNNSCDTGLLDVKFPPSDPICPEAYLLYAEEDLFILTCESYDGNPLATLSWINCTDGSEMILTTPSPNGDTSVATLEWNLTRVDNQGMYRCDATNLVQTDPLSCITGPINVTFAPLYVDLSGYDGSVHAGSVLILTCKCGSSNPASSINWYKNNTDINNSDYEEVVDQWYEGGEFHGTETFEDMKIDLVAEHNSAIYHCDAIYKGDYVVVSHVIVIDVKCEY
ncbi:neural cell adhesion molecule 1-like [Saccoglossus kowalevskii]